MIKEFKPTKNNNSYDEKSLIQLAKKGDLNSLLKVCRRNDISPKENIEYFIQASNKLIVGHRTNELLSFIYKHPAIIDVDKVEILKKTLSFCDYHGFLKNCFRFKIYKELKDEIVFAITKVRKEEAESWQKKFNQISRSNIL